MKVIGLIGGIASGKSAVAAEFAELGAVVLDADRAAHEVIDLPSVQQLLVDRWGRSILKSDETTDRAAVAKRVFGDSEKAASDLAFLEQVLHPRIRERFEARLAELADSGANFAVIDAPLLLEAGWAPLCYWLIFVDSPRNDRLERARRRNWTETEFSKREACQMPIAEKRSQSTHTLVNSGTLAGLKNQVRDLWASLDAN